MQRSILLVDDDVDILESIKTILETEDYTVYTALDAAQARAIILEKPVHLVIIDYIFGEFTGDQLIRDLKEIDENFSVIFLSGWPQVIKAIESLEFDVYRVFLKPIDPEILLSAIKSIFTEYVDPYQHLDTRQILSELTPFYQASRNLTP
jgi:DNA-binding response OmpR family regulator